MKITKARIQQIIAEEYQKILNEKQAQTNTRESSPKGDQKG
jgi:hypothetical protein